MRRSTLLLLALAAMLGSACTHAPDPTPSVPPVPTAPTIGDPAEPPPPRELSMVAADPDTTVLVMEADDLGRGLDTITATPKRPSLPSMMTDIAMAPSR